MQRGVRGHRLSHRGSGLSTLHLPSGASFPQLGHRHPRNVRSHPPDRHTKTHRHPLWKRRRVADRKLTEHSGSTLDTSHLPGHLEQSWAEAYRKLRPLMACKTLYYEATAIFFREKQFVLASKQPPIFPSSLIDHRVLVVLLKLDLGRSLGASSLVGSLSNPGTTSKMLYAQLTRDNVLRLHLCT